MKDKLPIWLTDWIFIDPKTKKTYVVERIFAKGWTKEEVINNPMLVNRALKSLKVKRIKSKLIPKDVVFKSQHGYGPHYEDEKLFSNGKTQS
tara:strand:- start:128 stop:403 length:276 start_codon:yes stop_codon:yes gene_type:complete